MSKKMVLIVLFAILALALVACGGSTGAEDGASGSATAGETLFNQQVIGAQAGCATCHSLSPDTVILGPSLAGVGTRAATRVAGVSAKDYLHTSIVNPNDYLVEGFAADIMVQVWADELSATQIDDLVAFLLTLK